MLQTYQPSGKFSSTSLILLAITALIAAPVLALAYTYAVWYIPIIYLNVLLTIVFGVAIGWVVAKIVVVFGKVRNPLIAGVFGFIVALFAYYFHCVVWVDLLINSGKVIGNSRMGIAVSNIEVNQVLELVVQPDLVWHMMMEAKEEGTWALRSATVNGTPLTIIWVIEFLIIVIGAIIFPIGHAREPFSEDDNKWLKQNVLPITEYIIDINSIVSQVAAGEATGIQSLKKVTNKLMSHSVFTIYGSERGQKYISIKNMKSTTSSKGESDFDETEILDRVEINDRLYRALTQPEKPATTYTVD